MSFSLRPVGPDDDAFLCEVYSSTRREELDSWGWDSAQRDAFLKLQFAGHQAHFTNQFPGADHSIVMIDGRAIGRMVIVRMDQEIRLADIALLPEYRNAGIGTSLISGLLSEGAAAGKPVRLHVTKTNRAQQLYSRLGFVQIGDTGTHFLMEWAADRIREDLRND
jgi:ribosomal protein S18 acetylase RimI-like enzyme